MKSFPQTLYDTIILQTTGKNPRNQPRYNLNEGVHLPTMEAPVKEAKNKCCEIRHYSGEP